MAILTSYDWESDTFTHHAENTARKAWREAVAEIAEKAKATLPDCAGRVDRAVQMVLNHDVELLEDGKLPIDAMSATSAGAMNAVVAAYGLSISGPDGAREKLEEFWRHISSARPALQSRPLAPVGGMAAG